MGSRIVVMLDTRQMFSIVDDQKPILSGSFRISVDNNARVNVDNVELRGPGSLPPEVTTLDWSLLGITFLKSTQTGFDGSSTIEFFPGARVLLGSETFSYTLLGFELGGWGLAITVIVYAFVLLVLFLKIVVLVSGAISWALRRLNQIINRTVIKGKARIYRTRAQTDEVVAVTEDRQEKLIRNDVFISHSHKDLAVANLITANLESKGLKVWTAPRDVPAGNNYQEAIIDAIDASHIMVLVFSAASNNSPRVVREITRAVSQGVTLIPFRIENVPLSKPMEYLIGVPHWMEATEPPMDDNIDRLAVRVKSIMKGDAPGDEKTNK
jgi:hypothetical protein